MTPDPLVDQLRMELRERASALLPFLPVDPEALRFLQTVEGSAPHVAQQLRSSDDNELAQTVSDLMNALWPNGSPEQCGQPEWWRTPVGRVCAKSLGIAGAEEVTHSVAAAMLGVTRSTVATLVARGTLDRHPDGGVLRSSVLARLAR